jgi:hypothetical protein
MKLLVGGMLTIAAVAAAQELTPRQLFYQDDAPAKPATAPPKAAPKSAPKKAAPARTPPSRTAPKAEAKPEAAAPAQEVRSAPAAGIETPVRVTPASYETVERPLGLRYALVQVANGAEREVSPDATFRAGDQVRVKVEVNRPGYLYVIARGSSGVWKPLFPAPEINGGNNRIEGRHGYRLPSDSQAFVFDEQPGQEQLFVIFSAEPVQDMDSLIPSVRTPEKELKPGPLIMASASPIQDPFVSRLRNAYARDLVVQTVTPSQPAGPGAGMEGAVYVVSKTGNRVVADIKLEHR